MLLVRLRRSTLAALFASLSVWLVASRSYAASYVAAPQAASPPASDVEPAAAASPVAPTAPALAPSVVTGGDHSAVSDQSISVPQGAGKIQGMGESFSEQLSTGVATGQVPIALPDARGGAQPGLALVYSSANGHGVAGVGWDIGVASISRQTDRGLPAYLDPPAGGDWTPQQDRFVIGADELVPICLVQAGGICARSLPGEVMPEWANGWQYFRTRIEGRFARFFWSPDHRTWRVQDKSGVDAEFGVPLDGSGDVGGLETDPDHPTHIFRWNLVRQYDAHGDVDRAMPAPVNVVVYRYFADGRVNYLQDIFDTPPQANAASAATATFAHHVHLSYEARPDANVSYRRGWAARSALRFVRADVTSKTFLGGSSSAREQVRRYWATYDASRHVSLLAAVQLEGKCDSANPTEDAGGLLPAMSSCPRLPATTFAWSTSQALDANGAPVAPDISGYEAFDNRLHAMTGSPSLSIDGLQADLFDLDSDALPDVLATTTGFGNGDGAFVQSAGGAVDRFDATTVAVNGVGGDTFTTLTYKNPNVTMHDLDGDGVVDLVHMPAAKQYFVYTPTVTSSGWVLQGRVVATASGQNIQLNFSNDNANIKTMDVNGDGLVDVVYSTGTAYETFFSLGRYAGGEAQYGQATWLDAATVTISNSPVTACVPMASTAVRLGDADVRVADVNGDGLPDVVRVRSGDIQYWPGRGNGLFGTGAIDSCPASVFGAGRQITMHGAPQLSMTGAALRLDDVNGDGLADLVQVRANAIDVWLNVDGVGWTAARHTITATVGSNANGHVRIADMNGSGVRDVLWADGAHYRYLDPMGGQRPWLLTHIANGFGKTTEYEYASSTSLMQAAARAGSAWQTKMPIAVQVVTRVTQSDNLPLAGRAASSFVTDYEYRDPLYDGRQREFRGFATTRVTRQGDTNSPTAITETHFLLGACEEEPGGVASCDGADQWRDNPREPLKGLPSWSESFDEGGNYQSTIHHTYRLRRLYVGSDGREVRHAFASATDEWRYDDGPFSGGGGSSVTLTDVELELSPGGSLDTSKSASYTPRAASGTAHLRSRNVVDPFGNGTDAVDEGCVDGCSAADEIITRHSEPGRPAADGSGWRWRNVESWVSGSRNATRWKHTFTQYDAAGEPTVVTAALSGTLPLVRRHEDAAATVAPPPANASSDGVITVSTTGYDPFGNLVSHAGAHGHCRTVAYDEAYAELATTETVFVGAATGAQGCGATGLGAVAAYDRGLGLPTMVVDLHGGLTTIAYNGFGWPIELHKPSPSAAGVVTATPSLKNAYVLPVDATVTPYTIVHSSSQDGVDAESATFAEAWAYADGFGRPVLTLQEADPGAGDGGAFIVNGLTDYDAKGAARRVFEPWFWSGDPSAFPLTNAPATAFTLTQYDAFGRVAQHYGLDGVIASRMVYHALAEDDWDAGDLEPAGAHQGTPASVRRDGHDRIVATVERVHTGGGIESREVQTEFLPGGEKLAVRRIRVRGGDCPVVRWFRYDSLGRMVLNVEPDTSVGFRADPTTDPSAVKAWRYAWNDDGELAGTSDARGCGENYAYDTAGRLIAEDYSPCLSSQPPYSTPNLTTGDGAEVFNVYDTPDAGSLAIPGLPIDASLSAGRLVSISDRGAKTVTRWDARGRVSGVARRLAKPGTPSDTLATRYTPHWYVRTIARDGADRVIGDDSGADVAELLGSDGKSRITIDYTARGALREVGGSYGTLVKGLVHDAGGLNTHLVYGDLAGTTTDFTYDARRRLSTVVTQRGAPSTWSAATMLARPLVGEPTQQLLLQSVRFGYDVADNPISIEDLRDPTEWPDGAKPASRTQRYDDLYRLVETDYQPTHDPWTSPFASEDVGYLAAQRAMPTPHLAFDARVVQQTFAYDWLGNTVATDDDAHGFYDRSLGSVANDATAAYRLTSASNEAAYGTGPRTGHLSTAYDASGAIVDLVVVRQGSCLPAGASCTQRFVYDWDEVGRLVRARRWDTTTPGAVGSPLPTATPAAELRFAYGSDDERTRKTAIDPNGSQTHTAYVFASLELRRTSFDGTDYQRTPTTEVPYLFARNIRVGRVAYGPASLPSTSAGEQHVFLEMADHLGSSAIVVDMATSELVERSSYQAYGAADSDYRPSRWDFFREDHRFTGKEEDVELGLTYFGKRYYAPQLGRWISADPLAIHELGADLNVYAYVHGHVLTATDPQGLVDFPKPNWPRFLGYWDGVIRSLCPLPMPKTTYGSWADGSRDEFEAGREAGMTWGFLASLTHGLGGGSVESGPSVGSALLHEATMVSVAEHAWDFQIALKLTNYLMSKNIIGSGGKSTSGGTPRPKPADPPKTPKPPAPEPPKPGPPPRNPNVTHEPDFDSARQAAFEKAGMTDPDKVKFTKVDPKTGTVVEFKGGKGAKVAYDSPHADMDAAAGHDKPHVGWQTEGKGTARSKGNITYDGEQHPSRSDTLDEGSVEPH